MGGENTLIVRLQGGKTMEVRSGGTLDVQAGATLNMPDGSVDADDLSATLKKGYIPLDIAALRFIDTNEIDNLVGHGGIMAIDSTPKLDRINGATDKALRVEWVADGVTEVQFPQTMMPPDLDETEDISVHLLALMSGSSATPVIDIQVADGIGDTEMGGNTSALTAALAEYSVTISAANIAGHPLGFLNIGLVPAAHATDALWLHGAWIEYTRK